ncbi:MAG: HEAT repeat domain-containing protein [Planctomycetes bacterium]|nr:HEAT repeat domain-containing protein [Planctomycetota bacterium]
MRVAAVRLLGSMKTRPEVAVPALAAALEDSALEVRRMAATALGSVGGRAAPAVGALAAATASDDQGLRYAAISTLGSIGPAASAAVLALLAAARTPGRLRQAVSVQRQYSMWTLYQCDEYEGNGSCGRQASRWAKPAGTPPVMPEARQARGPRLSRGGVAPPPPRVAVPVPGRCPRRYRPGRPRCWGWARRADAALSQPGTPAGPRPQVRRGRSWPFPRPAHRPPRPEESGVDQDSPGPARPATGARRHPSTRRSTTEGADRGV